jgi:predicted RNA binding protein YcfA (HicA-like mRNA interferase family)
MPKGREVLAGLTKKKGGWQEVHRTGSHHKLRKGGQTETFSYHDADELGTTQLRIVARKFGYTLDELKGLL